MPSHADPHGTELDDLGRDPRLVSARFDFVRDARLFASRLPGTIRPQEDSDVVRLAPNELHRPPIPADVVVRLGQLRVSEFLPDGREVVRAVLQAGSFFRVRAWPRGAAGAGAGGSGSAPGSASGAASGAGAAPAARPPAPWHDLAYIVLMALDEAELWILPAGLLDDALPVAHPERVQEGP